jgi:hypothetical protein
MKVFTKGLSLILGKLDCLVKVELVDMVFKWDTFVLKLL